MNALGRNLALLGASLDALVPIWPCWGRTLGVLGCSLGMPGAQYGRAGAQS